MHQQNAKISVVFDSFIMLKLSLEYYLDISIFVYNL